MVKKNKNKKERRKEKENYFSSFSFATFLLENMPRCIQSDLKGREKRKNERNVRK